MVSMDAVSSSTAFGLFVTVMVITYFRSRIKMRFWEKESSNQQKIEAFIKSFGLLAPRRFSYSDIKKMTNSFQDKLGQGGYGGVYKGKLLDGRLVAVKLLSSSKGNGEDFLNEVASISKTSHVNVVALLGFCFQHNRRALVYEFMPNGSLDKLISDVQQLGLEKLSEIAIGIARGLEYLHCGCSTRILHLDIKPHNILLDEDFTPKIADFGLAKLFRGKESKISMSEARGTVGYIAPEVFCRNFGNVSHKSDVYSYGMMILEMVGGRNKCDIEVSDCSEMYFPQYLYNQLKQDENLGMMQGILTREQIEITRKMIIVGLWCIQTDPSQRPSINKVLKMLEGSIETLQVPPRHFVSSPPRPSRIPAEATSLVESSQ